MARPKKVQAEVIEGVDEVKEEIMAENEPIVEEEIEIKPVKRLVCPGDKTNKFQIVMYGKPVLIVDPDGSGELIAVDTEVEDAYVCVTCHRVMDLSDLEEQDVVIFAA